MKKLYVLIGIMTIGIISIGLFLYISFLPYVDMVEINLHNERIYLILQSDNNGTSGIISKSFFISKSIDTTTDYVDSRATEFYYKINNDSLFIYGGNWINSSKQLIKNLKFIDIGDSILLIRENYGKLGLKKISQTR
jgi:hypothetical protein